MRIRTDPATIRAALKQADQTTPAHAAKLFGISHKSVYRWIRWRTQNGPDWPTDQNIRDWQTDNADRATERAHKAAIANTYRNNRYLNGGQKLMIPSLGTTRRLQALLALGHNYRHIGIMLGVTHARIAHLGEGRYPYLYPTTVNQIAAVYDQLCMTVPEWKWANRSRNLAKKRGYHPPLAWDNIDDPDEKPAHNLKTVDRATLIDIVVVEQRLAGIQTRQLTPAELHEVIRIGRHQGMTSTDLRNIGINSERYAA